MKPPSLELAHQFLGQAYQALRQGDRRTARRLAERAASLAPNQEEPWLFLAALAHPRASVAYLKKALEINPESQRAREAMHWAAQRLRAASPARPSTPLQVAVSLGPDGLVQTRQHLLTWVVVLLFVLGGLGYAFTGWTLPKAFAQSRGAAPALASLYKPTYTATPTATATHTATPTPTPTATFTPTHTPTFTPSPTSTLPPSATPVPRSLPEGVGLDEAWVDVDLSQQRAHAYRGQQLVRTFVVSTGTWRYPTVTGTYRIYVKYRFADMAGPGYYLPDVPYVMYFYRGYGLHGTYWHNNFGTPMSHGCVNFTIDDAGWLFDFASVGTIVHVHY